MKALGKRAASRRMRPRGGRPKTFRGAPELFRLAVESLSEYAILTMTKDFRISSWSGPAAALFGYTEAEMLGQSVSRLFTPEGNAQGSGKIDFAEALTKGRQENERSSVRKDGRRLWCYVLTFPLKDETGFVQLIREDPSRTKMEDLGHDSEARLSQAAESTGLGIWGYDVAKRSLTMSKRAVELFELGAHPKAAFYYEHFFKMIHHEDRARVARWFDECLLPGAKCAEEMEFRINLREGGIRWVQTRAKVFLNGPHPRGKPDRLVGTILDVTDRRRRQLSAEELRRAEKQTLERETQELSEAEQRARSSSIELEARVWKRTAQLRRANKELSAFNYSVSHDLRAPLRSIAGFSSILRTTCQGALDEKGAHYLERIELATRKMSALIDAMLSLSRTTLADLVRRKMDLSKLARSIGRELQEAHPERKVRLSVEPGMRVGSDKALLEIALRCLLGNAWKFTARSPEALIEVGSVRGASPPVYFVRDNGVGFEEKYAHKMFQPFQRLHPQEEFEGTGIGLSLVARIIERHGGRVWAQSTPGHGATFYFTLRPKRRRGGKP